jgi:hypothetical protein
VATTTKITATITVVPATAGVAGEAGSAEETAAAGETVEEATVAEVEAAAPDRFWLRKVSPGSTTPG